MKKTTCKRTFFPINHYKNYPLKIEDLLFNPNFL